MYRSSKEDASPCPSHMEGFADVIQKSVACEFGNVLYNANNKYFAKMKNINALENCGT